MTSCKDHIRLNRFLSFPTACTALAASTVLLLSACSGSGSNTSGSADSQPQEEVFHADNDIAMTVRSLVDAIKVGQPIAPADYDFTGILTDGQGTPLYTDIEGGPGKWEVDVKSPGSVVMRNLYPGDLLPDDLREYVAANINLTDADIIECREYDDDCDTDIVVYDFGGGQIRFETRAATAGGGIEGPLMSIIVAADNSDSL